MKTRHQLLALLLPVALSIAALSACTSPDDAGHGDSDGANPNTTGLQISTKGEAPAPALSGMSLDNAREYATSRGVELDAEDASQAKRDVTYDEQWIVIDQAVPPGESITNGQMLSVAVLLRGEYPPDTLTRSAEKVLNRQPTVMIDFVGMNLAEATDIAEANGLDIDDVKDASADHRQIIVRSNWTIVAQDVVPGSARDWIVDVMALKHDEVDDMSAVTGLIDEHEWESTFIGTVTGYESADFYYSPDQELVVLVDDLRVEMDLIAPFTAACVGDAETEDAIIARNTLLPIGTTVMVVHSDPESRDRRGFIHILSEINPLDPLDGSTNEQLVAGGYWVPDHWMFNDRAVADGKASTYHVDWEDQLTTVQTGYASRILAAGSTVIGEPTGGMVLCAEQLTAYNERAAELQRESDERARQFELEYERRKAAGYYWCRDGDGDGICHER